MHRTREDCSRRHYHQGEEEVRGLHHAKASIPVHHLLREIQPNANQQDYVQRWLAQTAEELPEAAAMAPQKHGAKEIHVPSKLPSMQRPEFPLFLQNKDHECHLPEWDGHEKRGKYGIEVSSETESSFLERGHAPKACANERGYAENVSPKAASPPQERRKRKRSPSPAIEAGSVTSVERPKGAYERRARHKTKEDRYDVKKKLERKEGRSRPKKEKKRAKMSKKAGENPTHNFESKKVANERLTASACMPNSCLLLTLE